MHVEDYADFVQRDTSKLGPDVPAFDAAIAIETIECAHFDIIASLPPRSFPPALPPSARIARILHCAVLTFRVDRCTLGGVAPRQPQTSGTPRTSGSCSPRWRCGKLNILPCPFHSALFFFETLPYPPLSSYASLSRSRSLSSFFLFLFCSVLGHSLTHFSALRPFARRDA